MKRRAVLSLDNELLRSERELRAEGFCWIAGVDEAGRGPLAGPVTAAAVIFPWKEGVLPGVFDSKQLSAAAREELFEELQTLEGVDIGIGIADAGEIDRLNILKAAHLAMFRAVEQLKKVDYVLVDGLPVKGFPVPSRNLVKGDARSASIAAASIYPLRKNVPNAATRYGLYSVFRHAEPLNVICRAFTCYLGFVRNVVYQIVYLKNVSAGKNAAYVGHSVFINNSASGYRIDSDSRASRKLVFGNKTD